MDGSHILERHRAAGALLRKRAVDGAMAVHRGIFAQSIVPSTEDGTNFCAAVAMAAELVDTRTALEIGCLHGLSTAVLAMAGFLVWTWDVQRTDHAGPLWDYLGVRGQITHQMRQEHPIGGGPYGLVFIDAVHELPHVRADFDEARKFMDPQCCVAVFDDIRYSPGILDWFKTLPDAVDMGRFGYAVLRGAV